MSYSPLPIVGADSCPVRAYADRKAVCRLRRLIFPHQLRLGRAGRP